MIQAFFVAGKEKERTTIYKPQPATPGETGRLSFYKESNPTELPLRTIGSVLYH